MKLFLVGLFALALTACGADPVSPPAPPVADAASAPAVSAPADTLVPPDLPPAPVPAVTDDALPPPAPSPPPAAPAVEAARGESVAVTVTGSGFEPDRIALPAGVASTLVFTRTTDATCATSVKSPALGIPETPLPLGQAVRVEVMPAAGGEFAFACGMDMTSGVVVAR